MKRLLKFYKIKISKTFFVLVLLVSDVPLCPRFRKPVWIRIQGSRGYRGRLKPKVWKQKEGFKNYLEYSFNIFFLPFLAKTGSTSLLFYINKSRFYVICTSGPAAVLQAVHRHPRGDRVLCQRLRVRGAQRHAGREEDVGPHLVQGILNQGKGGQWLTHQLT